MTKYLMLIVAAMLMVGCVPDEASEPCARQACGYDQGVSCGSCAGDYFCSPKGQCMDPLETADCADKECGKVTVDIFDGTKEISCGECSYDGYCSPDDKCVTAKWTFTGNDDFSQRSSPSIADDGSVYIMTWSMLYAINADGTEKWRRQLNYCPGTVVIGNDGTLYVGWGDGLSALDPTDGSEKWLFSMEGNDHYAAGLGSDGTIYAVRSDQFDGALHALRPDGTEKWSFVDEVYVMMAPEIAIGADDTVYFFALGTDLGHLTAVDKTGKKKWMYEPAYAMGDDHLVIGSDGTIYASGENYLDAIDSDGNQKWRITTDCTMNCAPSLDTDGTIYHPSNYDYEVLVATNPDSSEKWRSTPSFRRVVVGDDGSLYGADFDLYSFSADHTFVWSIDSLYSVDTPPALGKDGTLYFADGSKLIALPTQSSGPAKSAWPMYKADARHTSRVH